jgi:predicted nucleotidyltransferase
MDLASTSLGSVVHRHRDEIVALAHRHHAVGISGFGSVARGDANAASDIDFLVEFEPTSSLARPHPTRGRSGELRRDGVDVISAGGLYERDADIRRDAIAL